MSKATYDFPVEIRKIEIEGGIKVANRLAVVRTDTKQSIAIVSDKYKVVPHKEVLDVFHRVKNIKEEGVDVCKGGALLFGRYSIGDKRNKAEVAVGDVVQFGMRVFNSYDMSTGVGFEVTALRLKCTNGLLVPSSLGRFSFKHFEKVDVPALESEVVGRLKASLEVVNEWDKWLKIKPTEPRINKFFEEVNGLGDKDSEKLLKESLALKDRNVWQIYNVVTAHLSHGLNFKKETDKIATIRRREFTVLPAFHNYQWN
jgi:hypothetical protein